jgi:hypothetical protein
MLLASCWAYLLVNRTSCFLNLLEYIMRQFIIFFLLGSVVLLSACSGVDDRTAINTGAGALIGATAGGIIGNNLERGNRDGGGRTGALVGGVAGALIGYSTSQNADNREDDYYRDGFYGSDGRYYIYRNGVAVPAAPPAGSYYDDRRYPNARYYAPRESSMRLSY